MTTIKDRPIAPQYTSNYIIKVKLAAVFISEMITNQENTRSKVLQQRPSINGSSNILRNKHYFECFPFVLGLMLKHTKYPILNVKKIQMQNSRWGMGLAPTICAILLHVHMLTTFKDFPSGSLITHASSLLARTKYGCI